MKLFGFQILNNIVKSHLFILFYISLIVGFYFGEDLNFGSRGDWYGSDFPIIKDLSSDLKNTLLDYKSYGHRHSPVYLIFLSLLKKIRKK